MFGRFYIPESVTETIFKNICSFHPGEPFSGFFQETSWVHRTDTNFQRGYVCLPNRYYFSRNPFYVFTEQIPIFQEPFFGYWTDTDFPGARFWLPNRYRFSRKRFSNINEQIGNFQEGSPLRTDNSAIGLVAAFIILSGCEYSHPVDYVNCDKTINSFIYIYSIDFIYVFIFFSKITKL